MGPHTPTIDDAYRRYADLLLRHGRLLDDRGDEDPATEAVEEEMTRLWDRLDAVQRRSVSGLGSDLNWVRRGCQTAPCGRRPEEATPRDFEAVEEARNHADWHGVLHHLRACSPGFPPILLAKQRAIAWQALGFPRLASLFFDLASELETGDGRAAYAALQTALQVDPQGALERARTILKDPSRRPVQVVALAVTMLLQFSLEHGPQIDPTEATELLHGCLERLHLETLSDAERATIYNLAAVGFHLIGRLAEARHAYEVGLRLRPDDARMLTGLGLLLYGRDDDAAAETFMRAAKLQSPLFLPLLFLAHYHISRSNFAEALACCAQALARPTPDPIRAQLLEWAAICENELAFPDEAVNVLFREAKHLDPANERIAKNQRAFERGPAGRQYDLEPADSLKVRGAAEILTFLTRPAA